MREPDGAVTQVASYALEEAQPKRRVKLAWRDAAGAHELELTDSSTLGSAPPATVVVSDRAVSRMHVELVFRADGLWARDLGSRNGTYVAGVKTNDARLVNGATLRVGTTELTVTYDAASAAPPDVWPHAGFGPLLGRSAVMREIFAQMARMAATDSSILVTGETGTGKEIVARALHDASPRAQGPYVVVDCASLPENLLESELFGHARGAFTGAVAARVGAFEAADGGTIFLDEVGELPLALQPKLLRVLESRTIRRIGETSHKKVDVRILSATHRDLRRMVNQGTFREDLFFRLAVLPLTIPPLRERAADIPMLLQRFLGANASLLTSDLAEELAKLPWSGNVRELRNFAERLVAVGPQTALAMAKASTPATEVVEPTVTRPSRPDAGEASTSATFPVVTTELEGWFDASYRDFRDLWNDLGEREYLRRLMYGSTGGNAAAAKKAGIERTYLYRLLKKHGL